MRRFATTVSVVTARHAGESRGVTATAVTSVSLEPPSLLVVLSGRASALPPLLAAGRFCVNVLTAEQQHISEAFSSRQLAGRRFEYGSWVESDGYLRLEGCQASAFCELRQSHRFGTHFLCIGEVKQVHLCDDVNPLMYVNGRYFGALQALQSPA